jgi:CIC family chloride channel protein
MSEPNVPEPARSTRSSLPPAPAARTLRFTLGVVCVSVASALFAVGFRYALSATLATFADAGDVVAAMRKAAPWQRVVLPAAGGLLAGLIVRVLARSPQGGGVSDVMEAVVLGKVRLPMRSTLLKSLASWFAIVSGGSLGREGPLIQFGGAAGKWLSDRLSLPLGDARRLIAAGTAAGFAAAYNTPFAAVLFVLEVVTGVVVLHAMVPVLVATVIASECTRWIAGTGPIYGQRAFTLRSPSELLAFAVLGLFAALASQLFMRLLKLAEQWLHGPWLTYPLRPALGGLLAGCAVAFWPEVAGNGYEPLNEILSEHVSARAVLVLIVAKALATSASVGSGSPGGVFTPALLIGGGVGYLSGVCLGFVPGVEIGPPGGYALVGMAAATAATTHAPLMAAVMAFELSGDYAIVLPLCLSTAIATAASRAMRKDSIYTAELSARGLVWDITMEGRRVSDGQKRGE